MFNGMTALVTGSTSGIGLGIATAFAERGANVVLNGFGDAAAIETIRSGLEAAHGTRVVYDSADLSKADAIESMMGRLTAQFGVIDILVNNAGIQFVSPVDEFPVERWNAILALNLDASFHLIRLVLPRHARRTSRPCMPPTKRRRRPLGSRTGPGLAGVRSQRRERPAFHPRHRSDRNLV